VPVTERGAAWRALFVRGGVMFLLVLSILGSALFVFSYWLEWGTHWLGFAMGAALVAFGAALVVIAHRVLPHATHVESREMLTNSSAEQLALELDFTRDHELGRRKFLWLGVAGAFGAFALAALAPIRSLGPRPDARLVHTGWRKGIRVVNGAGRPVLASEVPVGGALTVFPDGMVDSADGQAMLIRVSDEVAASAPVPPTNGIYVYSRVCTHVGCPVAQYLAQSHKLMCPCHQSTFNVLDGATPAFGPAGRPLPRLPITIGSDGIVTAAGDFDGPVGPSFWTLR
jgi:ubiquinol-cytochrome c reductase iron-sulfur subunit